jgi:hypothetical protein
MALVTTSSPHWSNHLIADLEKKAAGNPDLETHYNVTIANLRGMSAIEEKLELLIHVAERHITAIDNLASAIRTRAVQQKRSFESDVDAST